jgi:hypothetical protein
MQNKHSEFPWLSHDLGRVQKVLDGWHLQDVANHEDAQDFANAFIVAELVDDPAPEGHELSLEDVPLDPVERMARSHWEWARAQVEEASPTATKEEA